MMQKKSSRRYSNYTTVVKCKLSRLGMYDVCSTYIVLMIHRLFSVAAVTADICICPGYARGI